MSDCRQLTVAVFSEADRWSLPSAHVDRIREVAKDIHVVAVSSPHYWDRATIRICDNLRRMADDRPMLDEVPRELRLGEQAL
ncbi:MAG: hypothetical protein KAS72_10040 [Phycisphaerales bacterium]|nr:hypothetical protein [Phycisphaerales bacterium]